MPIKDSKMTSQLNSEQQAALASISSWLNTSGEPFFILSGSAGTGKTFCIRKLAEGTKGRFIFTAPTNKATKVLRESVAQEDYKPECRTIFSLLGLRLEANGEVKELKAPEDPIDLSQYKAIIVDEGSMVSAVLFQHIKQTAEQFRIKFLFLGDPAQLPPVGELHSPIWGTQLGSKLLTVVRHDNQILELATRLRAQVDRIAPTIKLEAANANDEGIWRLTGPAFNNKVIAFARAGSFSKPSSAKVIAWRNVEVNRFNKLIREAIFDNPAMPWLVGDRVLFTSPARDLDDEPVASTDDEGEITRVDEEYHGAHGAFKIYRIAITLDDNKSVIARVLHPDSFTDHEARVQQLSELARANPRKWRDFWAFKDSFHQLRHAYAITSHRAQGSTYKTAFVYWQDILLNRNRQEAYRCLYVACTRPSKQLILS